MMAQLETVKEFLKNYKPFLELEARLSANYGNLVMVVKQELEHEIGIGLKLPSYDTLILMGVVEASPELDFEEATMGRILLPAEKHVVQDNRFGSLSNWEKWQLESGPIPIPLHEFISSEGFLESFLSLSKPDYKYIFHIGREVEQYFRKALSLNSSFVKALSLLGIGAPEEFVKMHEEIVRKEKIYLLNNLERLISLESKLEDEISKMDAKVGKNDFVEDSVDAFFATYKQREDLKKTKGRIGICLKEAIELNMHKDPWKLEWKNKGITMDVPKYILGLCESYKTWLC